MKTTIKRNLFIGFSISILLLLISSVASYHSIKNLLSSSQWVNHTDSVLQKLEFVMSTLKDAETAERGFLLTGEDKFLGPYNGSYERALSAVDEIKTMTADNPPQQVSSDQLRDATTNRFLVLDKLIKQKRSNQPITTDELEQGMNYMEETRSIIKLMEQREQSLLTIRTEGLNKYAVFTPIIILIAAILSVIITILVFFKNKYRP